MAYQEYFTPDQMNLAIRLIGQIITNVNKAPTADRKVGDLNVASVQFHGDPQKENAAENPVKVNGMVSIQFFSSYVDTQGMSAEQIEAAMAPRKAKVEEARTAFDVASETEVKITDAGSNTLGIKGFISNFIADADSGTCEFKLQGDLVDATLDGASQNLLTTGTK